MAKSYYKKIQGVRYDRALLESAEDRIKGQGDGRISDQDIHEIIDLSKDGNKVTLTELRTIKYIRDHFRVTEKAQKTLSDFIIQIETLKSESKEKEDLNITSDDFGSEEKDNDGIKEEVIIDPEVPSIEQENDDEILNRSKKEKEVPSDVNSTETKKDSKKSYYRFISGERYDRSLLEDADKRIEGQGDGRISEKDLIEVVESSRDGKGITETEWKTIVYITETYNLTHKATEWFNQNKIKIENEIIDKSPEVVNVNKDQNELVKPEVVSENDSPLENETEANHDDDEETNKNNHSIETESIEEEAYQDDFEEKDKIKWSHHLIWAAGILLSVFIGWNLYQDQLFNVSVLEKEVSDQNIIENELMVLKKQNEQLESQFQALEEDYLSLEKTKKELEVKLKQNELSKKDSNEKMKLLVAKMNSEKDEMIKVQGDLTKRIQEQIQTPVINDSNNCCYCTCEQNSFEESLKLVR